MTAAELGTTPARPDKEAARPAATRKAGRPPGSLRRANSAAAAVFLLPNLVMMAIFTILPLVFAVVISFQKLDSLGGTSWVGVANYIKLLTDPIF